MTTEEARPQDLIQIERQLRVAENKHRHAEMMLGLCRKAWFYSFKDEVLEALQSVVPGVTFIDWELSDQIISVRVKLVERMRTTELWDLVFDKLKDEHWYGWVFFHPTKDSTPECSQEAEIEYLQGRVSKMLERLEKLTLGTPA